MDDGHTVNSLRSHQLLGLALILVLFCGLGGWAAMAAISGAVIAQGRLVVETSAKKVQHVEGGIVSEILVRDGSHVAAGEPLLRLDQTETRANLAIIDAQYAELVTRQARLEAERDQAAEIAFPPDITGRLSEARIGLVQKGQVNLFTARREAKQGEQEQLKSRIEQSEEEIVGIEAQQRSKEKQLALISQELASLKGLKQSGLVTLNRMLALERELARLDGERGELVAQIARKRGEISETRIRIVQIGKNFTSDVASELRDTQSKLSELVERRLAAQIRLTRTEIRAPRSGMVNQLTVHTVGGVIAAGETVMLIVPEADTLILEAHVAPSDVDQLRVGQAAAIRLQAFTPATTPELIGQVALISPDVILEPQTNVAYYLVRVHVGQDELAKLKDRRLMPGMAAEAFITTERSTVLRYLLKPLSDRLARVFRER
jgi:HlyD family secretion protein